MPRPVAMSPLSTPASASCAAASPAAFAATSIAVPEPLVADVAEPEGDRVDPAAAASSSMKLSLANEFWIRAGERSGPVKNAESTVFAITRAFGTSPSSSLR